MDFKRIDNGILTGVPADGAQSQYHKAVPWCKRIFYFGTKPVTNPSRNCTNDECFRGGYLSLFQVPGWNYFPFQPIDIDYNYAQDHVFPVLDHMYLMCYSKFDGFYFYGLYQWNDETGGWKETNVIKNGDHTMTRDTDCSVCACNSSDQETAYITVLGEKTDRLKIFQIKKNPNWEGYLDMNNVVTVDNALGSKPSCILKTCVKDEKLYGLCGTPAECHSTWDPCKVLTVCLSTQTSKVEQCKGDNGVFPSFTNGPPQAAVYWGGKWVIVGGKDANGTFVPEIWLLNLETFQWSRSGQNLPPGMDGASLTGVQMDGVLFLADNKTGVFNYAIDEL